MMRRVIPSLFLLILGAASARAQARAGGEFQVNTITLGSQVYPAVALAPSGDFVVTWDGSDGSNFGILGRRYDAAGQPRGAAFIVNTYTTSSQFMSSVFTDARGGFLVAWSSFIDSHLRLEGQRFDPAGQPLGGEFQVSSNTASYEDSPVTAFDRDGSFVVAWRAGPGQDGDGYGIFARRFDAAGAPRGAQFQVNTGTAGNQRWPTVASVPAGGFVVAWTSGGGAAGAFGQRYDAAGQRLGGEFVVASSSEGGYRPSLVFAPDSSFVATWGGIQGTVKVLAHFFDAEARPRNNTFVVNQPGPSPFWPWAAGDASGNFTVAWSSYPGGAEGFDVGATRLAASGLRRGDDFMVNTYTEDYQYANRFAPSTASDPVGNFVVAWSSRGQDGSGYGIFAQRYGGLVPAGSSVDTAPGRNGVLEPGETVDVHTAWRNVNGATQAFDGTLTQLTGPAGATYTINDASGTYGSVGNGATAPCTGCYAVTVSAPAARPATHWDAAMVERIVPDILGQTKRWPLHVGRSFADVPVSSPFYRFAETLLHTGVTAGCSAGSFCPAGAATREQMAAFVLVAREGSGYLPPACTVPLFADVPASSPFCRWVEELARRGVAGGCGQDSYCPSAVVTREQMAVFLLRTLDPALGPPACTEPTLFSDVPATSPFCPWIEELARRGISGGCQPGSYCPTAPVTREQMGAFLTATFGLSLYGPR